MRFEIADAQSEDLETISALENATLTPPWNREGVQTALQEDNYLVLLARDETGEAAGFLIGFCVGEEAELARLGVLPAFRRRGLAQSLVERARCEWSARGARKILLELRADNQAAQKLYGSLGFQIDGKRPDYYPNGLDAILMSLEC